MIRHRRLALLIGAFHAVAAAAAAQPRPVTLDDVMRLRSIADVRISPDGANIAYVVSTPSVAENQHQGRLYLVPSTGGSPRQLAENVRIFNATVVRPQLRWTPDSRTITFLALISGRPQVFGVDLADGAARPATSAPEGVFAFEWSPDGQTIAYLTRDPMSKEEEQRRADMSYVIRADQPPPPTRLCVQTRGGAPRVLTPPEHYVDSLSWSPDGSEIAYSAAPTSGFMAPYSARIYAVNIAGGAPRPIVDRPGMNIGPRYSPDGGSIAFVSTNGRKELMAPRGLAIASARGDRPGPIRMVSPRGAWVNEYVWSPDSRSIYFQSNDGDFARAERMFEQPLMRLRVDTAVSERLFDAPQVVYSLSLSADGRRLAYRAVAPRTMGDVTTLDVSTRTAVTLTEVNPELKTLAVGELKPVKWTSFDGMEIWGLLLTPTGYTGQRRIPLLVYCHGGPIGGVTYGLFPQFMTNASQVDPYPTAAFASAGYAVLFPMPRGGSGYGEEGYRMIVNAWGEGDYKDIMAGVDALVAKGIADPDRLGVMGASYGGFMTNWIVTQTGRFKAASSGASLSDLDDLYYLSEGGEFMVEYFKRPWEARESYVAHSPLTHAARVTTPLLIQHGERDPRVPIAGAWKFYRALKALGKTVEFDIYPRGGHILYEPALEREQMRRNLEWFQRWITP